MITPNPKGYPKRSALCRAEEIGRERRKDWAWQAPRRAAKAPSAAPESPAEYIERLLRSAQSSGKA